jgi:hypothetical protein
MGRLLVVERFSLMDLAVDKSVRELRERARASQRTPVGFGAPSSMIRAEET